MHVAAWHAYSWHAPGAMAARAARERCARRRACAPAAAAGAARTGVRRSAGGRATPSGRARRLRGTRHHRQALSTGGPEIVLSCVGVFSVIDTRPCRAVPCRAVPCRAVQGALTFAAWPPLWRAWHRYDARRAGRGAPARLQAAPRAGATAGLPRAQARDRAKETPMERLKRLRAAQISAAFAKESLTSAQRRLATERDHAARLQMQRSLERARSPSPPR